MTCHVCGSSMERRVTDLPFKIADRAIIIIKDMPVLQCEGCREFVMEDAVMERVERLLGSADQSIELGVIRFAA